MKTKEELTELKKEVEALSEKLAELTEDELKLVTGGASVFSTAFDFDVPDPNYEPHTYFDTDPKNKKPDFEINPRS